MKRALRATSELVLLTVQLYRELALSALTLLPSRRHTNEFYAHRPFTALEDRAS